MQAALYETEESLSRYPAEAHRFRTTGTITTTMRHDHYNDEVFNQTMRG